MVVDVVVVVVVVVTIVDDDVLVSWEGVVLLIVPVSVGGVAVQAMAMSNKNNRQPQRHGNLSVPLKSSVVGLLWQVIALLVGLSPARKPWREL